jgi:N-acetylglucosamine-6-phosphate deacetylase
MTSASVAVVRAGTVLTPGGCLSPGEVVVDGGLVVEARPATGPVTYEVLAPGFVDLQMNGTGAVDVAEAHGDDWELLDAALLAQGVTTWCPTLVSGPPAAMEASLGRITEAQARGGPPRPTIAGAHLEGPFLAVPGAHDPRHLPESVDARWLAGLADQVAVVTLAPELPGALDAIEDLVVAGVVVALGHSGCTFEMAEQAADAGARLVTHLGNAMGPFGQRRPGLLGAALSDDRLAVSVIADLVHVHRALIRIAFRAKGPERTVLVTDAVATGPGTAIAATARTPAGTAVDAGPPRMSDGTLVGSVLRLDRAVANTVEEAGIALADAVAAASSTPAGILGLDDRGAIAPGRRADLVGLGARLEVQTVWIAGEVAWEGGQLTPGGRR